MSERLPLVEKLVSQVMEDESKCFWADQTHLSRLAKRRNNSEMQATIDSRMEEEKITESYIKLLDDLSNDRITVEDFKYEQGKSL